MPVTHRVLTILLIGAVMVGCDAYSTGVPVAAPAASTANQGRESVLRLGVSDRRDTGVPGLLMGLDPHGHYFVAFGSQPEYWLTLTRLDTPDKPEVVAKIPTATAVVVPGTQLVAFVGAEKGPDGNPVYLVNTNGTGLTRVGFTETPNRLQATPKGLVAYRSGRDLVVYDTAKHQAHPLDGVELRGEYPTNNTEWAISPDGKRVALQDGQELTLLDLATGTRRTLPGTPDPYQAWPSGAWSPDGSLFAYGTTSIDHPIQPTLWVASPEAAGRALLVPSRAGNRDAFEDVQWVDNSTMLVSFVPHGKKPEAFSGTKYYAVSLDGQADVLFEGGSGLFVTADGKTLFFQRPTSEMYVRRPSLWTGSVNSR